MAKRSVQSKRLGMAVLATALVALAACGGGKSKKASTPTPGQTATPTQAGTPTNTPVPAAFSANGSVEQVYLLGAPAQTSLDLVGPSGTVVMTDSTDKLGSLIFRQVPPGAGYRVAIGSGESRQWTAPVTVIDPSDVPDPSFYSSQVITDGYQYVKTRDGTTLSIIVMLPGPIDEGPYPTVVEYSGYTVSAPNVQDNMQPSHLIAWLLGYAAVGVNIRGTGCSGGAFDFFETLQNLDGYDVIETIAAQPWVLGHKVGMVGLSYPGISQLFVAQTEPPHLASVAPLSVISDIGRGTLYPGGILNNGFATEWAADRVNDAKPVPLPEFQGILTPDEMGGQAWALKQIETPPGDEVCKQNQYLRLQAPDLFEEIAENKYITPYALSLSPFTFVDKIDVPVFLAGAWQDEQTGGYASTMLDKFTGTDKIHFTFTNGGHTEPFGPSFINRWAEFLSFYLAEKIPGPIDDMVWLAYRLVMGSFVYQAYEITPAELGKVLGDVLTFLIEKGLAPPYTIDAVIALMKQYEAEIIAMVEADIPEMANFNIVQEAPRFNSYPTYEAALAAYEAEPKMRILFENGAGDPAQPGLPIPTFEHSFSAWPIPEAEALTLYFREGGLLSQTAPTGTGADSFVYDPARGQTTSCDGCPSTANWAVAPPWKWEPLAEGEAVAYETEALEEDLVLAGSGSVNMWFNSTADDVDVQVAITEVRPDGYEVYVQSGWLRASRRKLDTEASTIFRPVATQLEADVEMLPAGEYVAMWVEMFPFAQVFRAGSKIRIIVASPGGDRPLWMFQVLDPAGTVVNTVDRSHGHASHVVLSVIPGITVPPGSPACFPDTSGIRGQPCREYVPLPNTPAS